MSALDALLPPVAEVSTSRERWAAWEAKHLGPIHSLGRGQSHHVPGGITVTHRADGFEVKGGGTLQIGKSHAATEVVRTPTKASLLARARSARSTHPDSLGGAQKIDHPGKPSGASAPKGGGSTPLASKLDKLKAGESHQHGPLTITRHPGGFRVQGTSSAGRYIWIETANAGAAAHHTLAIEPKSASGKVKVKEEALDAVLPPLAEAKDSLAKASTPEPFSKSRTSNWVARAGGLPAYIQHIAHDLHEKRGKSVSNAIQMAIGIVKNWASGQGKVDANTRAAARKAVAEWEAMKAKNAAKGAGRAALQHADYPTPSVADCLALAECAEARLFDLTRGVGPDVVAALVVEAESGPTKLKCPKCDRVQPASNSKCANCGHDLADARKAKMAQLNEQDKPKKDPATPHPWMPPKDQVKKKKNPTPHPAPMQQADTLPGWAPELKRTASAPGERERLQVWDGGQHVGTIARRPAYSPQESDRWSATAINGKSIIDMGIKSRQDAVGAVRRHLEEAPARVEPHRDGKFLVAEPARYDGKTQYSEYPSEAVARHAAGLPERPTSVERAAAIVALGECLSADLALVEAFAPVHYAELWGPMIRGRAEVARDRPFRLDEALAELFHPSERRDWHGRWILGGGTLAHIMRTAGKVARTETRQPHGRSQGRFENRPRLLNTAERIKAIGEGSWTGGARRAANDIQRGLAHETEQVHRAKLPNGKLGPYSRERTDLHARVIQALLQGHRSRIGAAEAHFMAGGPASGKSTLLAKGAVKLPEGAVQINPDTVKEMLPEYRQLVDAGHPTAASAVHEESSHIAALATNIALGQHMHVVLDTVGNSDPGKFARKIQNAHAAGHKVSVHYAVVPTDTAVARNAKRARTVPEGYLRAAHQSVAERFHAEIQHIPHTYIAVYDTRGKPKMVAEKSRGGRRMRVMHESRYAQFLAKAGIEHAHA